MLIAAFSFALTGACSRFLRHDMGPIQLVFFRNLIGLPFIVFALWRNPPHQEVGGKMGLLIFRGLIGTMSLYALFYSITKIGLAVATTYQQSYPVFLSVMAYFVFGERLKAKEWAAVLMGFAGICLIFFPQIDDGALSLKSNVIGFFNAVLTGSAYLSIRGLKAYYDTRTIVLSFMLCGLLMPVISMSVGHFWHDAHYDFMVEKWQEPLVEHFPIILLLGFAALFGQIFLTKAFSYEKTGIIAAVGYSNIVFSVFFGMLLSDAVPSAVTWAGILLVILCGVIIALSNKRNKIIEESVEGLPS